MHPLENDATVTLARDLIRIDTQNWGDGRSNGEQPAAELLANRLDALDAQPQLFEAAPGRVSVVGRIRGRNPEKPALVVHGHTDVVPADPAAWSVDPFAGEIRDGMLWGRGAVDMKDMDAMIVTALEAIHATGDRPERDLIVAFFADEEDTGKLGSEWLVSKHPELFDGASEAISEVGGYSVHIAGQRAYLMQTGEKALLWLRLHTAAPSGHGSRIVAPEHNAISLLARAITRLAEHEWPVQLIDTTTEMLAAVRELTGHGEDAAPDTVAAAGGFAASWLCASLRTTLNPTMLAAGYKHNVIPESATVAIDVRPLPGQEEAVLAEIQRIVGPDVRIETFARGIGTTAPATGALVDAAVAALRTQDAEARVLPYLLPAGTDNKALSRLGIHGYGFTPLQLPADLDFPSLFHGVDERVPLESLVFGRRVLEAFLRSY